MKKLLVLLVVLMTIVGCSSASGKDVKVGSAAITQEPSASEEGFQLSTVLATVVLDGDGKIVALNIDEAQNKATLEGETVTVPVETPTKKEKQDAYNMKEKSAIGKEWYEQVKALEAALVGKNIDEVKAVELNEGKVVDEDLKASVTISINHLIDVVVKAMENATDVEGAVAKVGSASQTSVTEKEGTITFDTYYAHIALDKDGKILEAFGDAVQNEAKVGEFDAFEVLGSKKERGEDYGMLKASQIGKEWNEQAEALEEAAKGKTMAEFKALANEDGTVADEDLKSSVTINTTPLMSVIEAAANNTVELGK